MRLKRKERSLEAGKKPRPEDQDRNEEEEQGEDRQRHFSLRRQSRDRSPSRRLMRARLPIIAGALMLRPS